MLLLSLASLLIAALLGSVLAMLLRRSDKLAPLGALHGLLGTIGLAALLLALREPPRGEAMGVGSFGRIAAGLLAMALLAGLTILVVRLRRRRVPGSIIGIHAAIAVSGVVILTAYTLLG